MLCPLFTARVQAGFPSPADDYIESSLDLNEHLIKKPAATKPSFRSAMKKRRRLIVADGFYEWQKGGRGKQPYLHPHEGR